MTISHRAHVQNQLLDPEVPLSTGLRALILLADEIGNTALAAWARQELDGHPATGLLPGYRTVSAPIYGVAMRHGAAVYQQIDLTDLPASHREEIARRDAALGLHMFFAGLPRYTQAPRRANRRPADPDAPALRFEVFVDELLAWVSWWNEHPMDTLDGLSPLLAWEQDPTPLTTVPAGDLRLFTLEDDGRVPRITTKGVQWRSRYYVGAWMAGYAGVEVRVRWMPHHDHEVEVFDARTGTYR